MLRFGLFVACTAALVGVWWLGSNVALPMWLVASMFFGGVGWLLSSAIYYGIKGEPYVADD